MEVDRNLRIVSIQLFDVFINGANFFYHLLIVYPIAYTKLRRVWNSAEQNLLFR